MVLAVFFKELRLKLKNALKVETSDVNQFLWINYGVNTLDDLDTSIDLINVLNYLSLFFFIN
jgi:hypothetical protein